MHRVQIISHGHANDVRLLDGSGEAIKGTVEKIEIIMRPGEPNRAVVTFANVSVNVEAESEL